MPACEARRAYFLDVDHCQQQKHGQHIAGDVFLSKKIESGDRVVSVLADGLGSGVEASVLASLTATMALEYVTSNIETRRAAEIVMDALPICRQRQISYSTFSIVDTNTAGATRVIEHGNPSFLLIRNGEHVPVEQIPVRRPRWRNRELSCSQFSTQIGDRIVFFSDGVSQSGIGTRQMPLGWGTRHVSDYLLQLVRQEPNISARRLSEALVSEAVWNDGRQAGDDITCGVIYFRQPRYLRVLTGPPFDMERDPEFAGLVDGYDGCTVVCGGTTSNIVARELNRSVTMNIREFDPDVPNTSAMDGVDLVTEGCLTLGKTDEYLESGVPPKRINGATRFVDMLLQSDVIEFIMGTRINEAHQSPSLPIELDIRRNVIKRIRKLLEEKYLKETCVSYF